MTATSEIPSKTIPLPQYPETKGDRKVRFVCWTGELGGDAQESYETTISGGEHVVGSSRLVQLADGGTMATSQTTPITAETIKHLKFWWLDADGKEESWHFIIHKDDEIFMRTGHRVSVIGCGLLGEKAYLTHIVNHSTSKTLALNPYGNLFTTIMKAIYGSPRWLVVIKNRGLLRRFLKWPMAWVGSILIVGAAGARIPIIGDMGILLFASLFYYWWKVPNRKNQAAWDFVTREWGNYLEKVERFQFSKG